MERKEELADDNINRKAIAIMTKSNILEHVLFYINSRSGEKPIKISDLTRQSIYENLKRDGISRKDVDKAIDQLVQDRTIIRKDFNYVIFIPKDRLDNLASEDKRHITPHMIWKLAIGLYFFISLVLLYEPLAQIIINLFGIKTIQNAFLLFTILGVAFSYVIGESATRLLKIIGNNIPAIKKYQDLIIPFFIFFIPISIIYGLGVYTLNEKITMTHILTIIGMSIAGAGVYWSYKKYKKE